MSESLPRTGGLRRRLVGGAAWAAAGRLVLLPSGLVISALVARLLEPDQVGVYFLALNMVVVGGVMATLGLDGSVLQQLPLSRGEGDEEATRAVIHRSFLLVAVTSLAGAGLYVFVLHDVLFPPLVELSAVAPLALPMAVWLVATTFQRWIGQVLRGLSRIGASVFLGGITQFGGVLASLLVAAFLGWALLTGWSLSLGDVILGSGVAVAVASLVGIAVLGREWGLSGGARTGVGMGAGALVVTGGPLLVSNLTQYLSRRADVWVLGLTVGDELTGLYLTVASLAILVNAPLTIVNLSLAPAIGELRARGELDQLERAVGVAAGMAFLPAVGLTLLFAVAAGPLAGLIFGPFYESGHWLVVILSLGQLASAAVGASGYVLLMWGRQVDLMICSVVGAGVAVVGCVVGGLAWGITGIALGSALGAASQQVGKLVMARARTGIWAHARPVAAAGELWRELRRATSRA